MVQVKRVYEDPAPADGTRVLVDRVWPRGITKERADVAWWAKDVGPSNDLRKWFGHVPERYAEFAKRYRAELKGNADFEKLRSMAAKEHVTLVYSAKDEEHNQARVLQDLLNES